MTEKIKENATQDFLEMIKHSWTWNKLTKEEKDQFEKGWHIVVDCWSGSDRAIKGSYHDRWTTLQAMYHMFLRGIGYDNDNPRWRC